MPSTTDHKEKINKLFGNVNLHPIDCACNDFINYSDKNHLSFVFTASSRLRKSNKKKIARENVQKFLKDVAEMSNSN